MMNLWSSCFWIILIISVVSGQYCGKITTQGSKNDTHAYQLRTLDDMTIFVEERGNINNPTIIFTHGYFASRLVWEPTFTSHRMLNQYHLVRWDLRGMGDSSKDGDVNKYNDLKFYANDVKLVVDDVKGRKAKANAKNQQIVLVTWSTGSIATLPYFGTFTDSEVDGYVSVGNNFKSFKSENIFTEFTRVTIGGVVTSETYILILDSLKNLFTKMTPANAPLNPPSLSFLIGIGAYAPTESRHAYGQLDYDFTSTFANLSIPTLSIFGSEDQIVNPVHSRQVSASRPENGLNSVLAYNGVGHVPMWEIPKKFELDLDNWIKRSIINPKPKNPKASSPINNNKQPDQPVKNPQEQSKQPQPKSV